MSVSDQLPHEVRLTGDFSADLAAHSALWEQTNCWLARLKPKPARSKEEHAIAVALLAVGRQAREVFLSAYTTQLYDKITSGKSRFVRIDELVMAAAALFPGLVPSAKALAKEANLGLAEKEGIEVDQGIFISHVLADEAAGTHLCHAMLLPRNDSVALQEMFERDGSIRVGSVLLEKQGAAAVLTAANERSLHAEDDTTLDDMERVVDVALLSSDINVVAIRGGMIASGKYTGRRVFGAGINLTRLYDGKIPFLWFLMRDMGYVHKIVRGLAVPGMIPDDLHGGGLEKAWIVVVETFAIGGHCQLVLCADYVVATEGAVLSLPARKEGIVPGLANLRLERFVGPKIARQAIQHGLQIPCDSEAGRSICDQVIPLGIVDQTLAEITAELTQSGVQSMLANRRALRVGRESLDLFRRYCAVYARDQAYCCCGRDLVENLERHWNVRNRRD